jgi:hypothetical protein
MNFTQQQVSEILDQLVLEQNGYQQILKYSFEAINQENVIKNLLRVEPASNQRLRRLFFCIHRASMNFE